MVSVRVEVVELVIVGKPQRELNATTTLANVDVALAPQVVIANVVRQASGIMAEVVANLATVMKNSL